MKPIYKIFTTYILILFLILVYNNTFGQTKFCEEDICVVEFNASWNDKNNVTWLYKLSDCETKRILIDKGSWQKDFSIVVTPTIIIFVNGKETKRYQANIMMEMEAKQTEVQDKIDEIIMEEF